MLSNSNNNNNNNNNKGFHNWPNYMGASGPENETGKYV
jgi:hypothetical protein